MLMLQDWVASLQRLSLLLSRKGSRAPGLVFRGCFTSVMKRGISTDSVYVLGMVEEWRNGGREHKSIEKGMLSHSFALDGDG